LWYWWWCTSGSASGASGVLESDVREWWWCTGVVLVVC
jgi:hypothetical protein